jgi:hypothetical protein
MQVQESDETIQILRQTFEILKPDLAAMMMKAYFDESGTHDGSPVMCVAGYLLSAEQAVHLDREWAEALAESGVSCFHMADCAHSVEDFIGMDPGMRKDLLVRLIGIIKRRVEIGIAVSISETDFGRIGAPEWKRGGPYSLAALQVLAAVVSWADTYSYKGRISYFFESGHKHQSHTNIAIEMLRMRDQEGGVNYLRYHSHTFAGKCDLRPLQAADLLAYEWQKELRRLNMPSKQKTMRRSLQSLLEKTHITMHLTATDLNEAFAKGFASVIGRMIKFQVVE